MNAPNTGAALAESIRQFLQYIATNRTHYSLPSLSEECVAVTLAAYDAAAPIRQAEQELIDAALIYRRAVNDVAIPGWSQVHYNNLKAVGQAADALLAARAAAEGKTT